MAVRAEGVVAVPYHAQGYGTEWASGRPLRTAFRALLKQRHVPTEWLSNFLQVDDETARRVAANEEMFHGLNLLCGAHFVSKVVRVNNANHVRSITEGFPDAELPANVAGGYCKGGARGRAVSARGTPVSSQSFAKQAVFAHHYWLARR